MKSRLTKFLSLVFLAVMAIAFAACDDTDDNSSKITPLLEPNNSNLSFTAEGGVQTLTVKNATELNITQINNKVQNNNSQSETNVCSVQNGKIANPKNVTEGGWFTAKVVSVDGVDKQIVFTVSKNTDTKNSRDKFIHVTCGDKLYGLSLHLSQSNASDSE